MTHIDFEHEFKKLKTKWKTYYTESMEEEAYLIIKSCPPDAFHEFVRKAMWGAHAPNLEAFVEFRNKNRVASFQIVTDCTDCDGKGNLSATCPENYDYWFACINCEAGHRKHKDLPRWDRRENGWIVNKYRMEIA